MKGRTIGLTVLLLVNMYAHAFRQQDSVLNRVISVRAEQLPVSSVLQKISVEEGIYFSYDASLVNAESIVSLQVVNITLREVLDLLFPHKEFRFIRKEDYIIITSLEEFEGIIGQDSITAKEEIIVLTGKVIDHVTREPLPYVSISLKNQPIGTITNQEGEFILKLNQHHLSDSLVFSFVGYATSIRPARNIQTGTIIEMNSEFIRIREVKVKAISVEEILDRVRNSINANYSAANRLMTGFYRENIRQDGDYISVSEAVLEILKIPYDFDLREDKVRLLKARKSPDVRPFHWVNFKLQGGPYTITKLDAVKTMETFIDKEFQHLYRYSITDVIWYKDHPVYVVSFRPLKNIAFPLYKGEMYIDRETYALIFARFSLDTYGLDMAGETLIRKKPRGFKVKPLNVNYQVNYQFHENKWQLLGTKAQVSFRVRSREDRVNSVFESESELLITGIRNTGLKRFPGKEAITINDIFVEMSTDYDQEFWGSYNIIKPDEELENAVRALIPQRNN
jgi:hypothetical protein